MSSTSTETKKHNFLEALLTSDSIKAACQKAHISRATATRYQNDPDFKAEYQKMQQKSMELTSNKIRSLATKAVATLSNVMDDDAATPTEKTRAAKIILDSAFHVQDTQDIINRLDKLESEADN